MNKMLMKCAKKFAAGILIIKKCFLILADEPTGSLDKANAEKVIKILQT